MTPYKNPFFEINQKWNRELKKPVNTYKSIEEAEQNKEAG